MNYFRCMRTLLKSSDDAFLMRRPNCTSKIASLISIYNLFRLHFKNKITDPFYENALQLYSLTLSIILFWLNTSRSEWQTVV